MGRPPKDGLDYFSLDTDWRDDRKIRLIKGEFGEKGLTVVLALWSQIYKDHGYYTEWDADACGILAAELGEGFAPGLIDEIVKGCVRRSLFDQRVLDVFQILTSHGIQQRYVHAVLPRKQIRMIREFCLLNPSDYTDVPASAKDKFCLCPVSELRNLVNGQRNKVNELRSTHSDSDSDKDSDSDSGSEGRDGAVPPLTTTTGHTVDTLCGLITDLVKPVTSSDRVMVKRWLAKADPACIEYAIREAGNAPQPSTGYVVSVLKALERDGVRTAEQLAARNARRCQQTPGVQFRDTRPAPPDEDVYFDVIAGARGGDDS